jgi:hypothetical protein
MSEPAAPLVQVEVVSSRAAPSAFFLRGQFVRVAQVTDQWPGQDHTYFRVRADDGRSFVLRQDLGSGAWRLTVAGR